MTVAAINNVDFKAAETKPKADAEAKPKAKAEAKPKPEAQDEDTTLTRTEAMAKTESESSAEGNSHDQATDEAEAKANIETNAQMGKEALPKSLIGTFEEIVKRESLLQVLKWGLVAGAAITATTAVVALVGVERLKDAKNRCKTVAVGLF